jgi:hypothetical protein
VKSRRVSRIGMSSMKSSNRRTLWGDPWVRPYWIRANPARDLHDL